MNSMAPPADFNWRAVVSRSSVQLVKERYPDLTDLAQDGTLVAWARPSSYVERREDGYEEPELVLMVGTAHVSERSARDVTRVLRCVRPDAVVVELCRSRSAVMAEPEPTGPTSTPPSTNTTPQALASSGGGEDSSSDDIASPAGWPGSSPWPSGTAHPPQPSTNGTGKMQAANGLSSSTAVNSGVAGPGASAGVLSLSGGGGGSGGPMGLVEALRRSASLGGQSGLLLRLLLAALASRTAGALGVRGGGEFLAARRAAEEVEAQVVLGDRPVEITLQRAWAALGLRQRVRLCWDLGVAALGTSSQSLNAELVERLKSDDALTGLLTALGDRYPELLAPLVYERDLYLAWSLKRSKAVRGAKVVVGVMGLGHMRGVVYALTSDQGGDTLKFSDLVGNMNKGSEKRRQAVQAAGRFALETGLCVIAYAAWLQYTAP